MIEDNEIALLVDLLRKNGFIPEDVNVRDIYRDGTLNLAGQVIVLKDEEKSEDKTLIISFNIENVNPYMVSAFMEDLLESGLKFEYGNGFIVKEDGEILAKENFN